MNKSDSKNDRDNREKRRQGRLHNFKEGLHKLREDVKNQASTAKFWLEVSAIVGLAVYTSIAGCQARIAHDTYVAANRPYVGVEGIKVMYLGKWDGVHPRNMTEIPASDTELMDFRAQIKNFGPVPSINSRVNWRIFMNGVEEKIEKTIPDSPFKIFPAQIVYLSGQIGTADYPLLMNGRKTLAVEVTVEYDGPSVHDKECTKQQFAPNLNAFYDLGPRCTK